MYLSNTAVTTQETFGNIAGVDRVSCRVGDVLSNYNEGVSCYKTELFVICHVCGVFLSISIEYCKLSHNSSILYRNYSSTVHGCVSVHFVHKYSPPASIYQMLLSLHKKQMVALQVLIEFIAA